VLVCALAGALLSWWLRPKLLDSGYFPIGVGYRWVYASKVDNSQEDVVFEVVGTEKVGDAKCFVVLRTIGDHQIKFYVEVNNRGVLIHQVGQDRYRPAYRQFAFYTKVGDRWHWKGMIGSQPGEYECWISNDWPVTVPLGEWDAFWVAQETESPTGTGDAGFWLVDGIGVVRIAAKQRDNHDPPSQPGESSDFDWQLKEFSRP
jgi:hypothetical protein